MAITWDTACPHSALSAKLAELQAALSAGGPAEKAGAIVNEIEALADRQFAAEEKRIILSRDSAGFEHFAEHDALKRRLRVLRVHLTVQTPKVFLAHMVKADLVEWWQQHVAQSDARLTEFERAEQSHYREPALSRH